MKYLGYEFIQVRIISQSLYSSNNSCSHLSAPGSTMTEKNSLFCNTHNLIDCLNTFMSFNQPGSGTKVETKKTKLHQETDIYEFVWLIYQIQELLQ